MTAFLRKVGGRQVDGDATGRQRQPRCNERGAYPLARFGDRLVGKPDDIEGGKAGSDLDLHVDRARFDALERHRRDPLDHVHLSPPAAQPYRTARLVTRTIREQKPTPAIRVLPCGGRADDPTPRMHESRVRR